MSANSTKTTATNNANSRRNAPPIDVTLPLFERVNSLIAKARSGKFMPYTSDLLVDASLTLTAVTVTPPSVTFTLTVIWSLCNPLGNLHGGAAATIFDNVTTCAVVPMAKPGYWEWAGVSRSLNCSYFRAVPMGETVTVYAEVVHAGKKMLTVKGEIRDKQGTLCVGCEHLKVNTGPEVKEKEVGEKL